LKDSEWITLLIVVELVLFIVMCFIALIHGGTSMFVGFILIGIGLIVPMIILWNKEKKSEGEEG